MNIDKYVHNKTTNSIGKSPQDICAAKLQFSLVGNETYELH